MHKICLSSGGLIPRDNIEEGFRKFKEAGFDGVDFSMDQWLPSNNIKEGDFSGLYEKPIEEILDFLNEYKVMAEKYGITFEQAHAPFQLYVDENDEINEKCQDVIVKCIQMCKFLSCPYLVVHPINIAYSKGYEYERKVNIEYYAKMIPAARENGVVICLENMFSSMNRRIREATCSVTEDTLYYIDTLNKLAGQKCFGFCADIGHYALLGTNIRRVILELGDRLSVLHLHENDGISDNHGIPFMYTRTWGQCPVIDWYEVLGALHDIGYQGPINFEACTGLYNIPVPVRLEAMTYLAALGRYFSSVVDGENK